MQAFMLVKDELPCMKEKNEVYTDSAQIIAGIYQRGVTDSFFACIVDLCSTENLSARLLINPFSHTSASMAYLCPRNPAQQI